MMVDLGFTVRLGAPTHNNYTDYFFKGFLSFCSFSNYDSWVIKFYSFVEWDASRKSTEPTSPTTLDQAAAQQGKN